MRLPYLVRRSTVAAEAGGVGVGDGRRGGGRGEERRGAVARRGERGVSRLGFAGFDGASRRFWALAQMACLLLFYFYLLGLRMDFRTRLENAHFWKEKKPRVLLLFLQY